jgi:hypothetical protein
MLQSWSVEYSGAKAFTPTHSPDAGARAVHTDRPPKIHLPAFVRASHHCTQTPRLRGATPSPSRSRSIDDMSESDGHRARTANQAGDHRTCPLLAHGRLRPMRAANRAAGLVSRAGSTVPMASATRRRPVRCSDDRLIWCLAPRQERKPFAAGMCPACRRSVLRLVFHVPDVSAKSSHQCGRKRVEHRTCVRAVD